MTTSTFADSKQWKSYKRAKQLQNVTHEEIDQRQKRKYLKGLMAIRDMDYGCIISEWISNLTPTIYLSMEEVYHGILSINFILMTIQKLVAKENF